MILLGGKRAARHDYWLGGSTAIVAGIVNVCSVVAFFAFASNVTGHVAVLTEELVKGHWHQLRVVGVWLLCFLGGAFVANALVGGLGVRAPRAARAAALGLELLVLSAVGHYGHMYYQETLTETEYLVGLLLFAMGLQNGLVATVSRGVVKTTHLTGLLTDLGMEVSMLFQRRVQSDPQLRFKLKLHSLVLLGYVAGGIIGGLLFLRVGFLAFHAGSLVLGLILAHDLLGARVLAMMGKSMEASPAPGSLQTATVSSWDAATSTRASSTERETVRRRSA